MPRSTEALLLETSLELVELLSRLEQLHTADPQATLAPVARAGLHAVLRDALSVLPKADSLKDVLADHVSKDFLPEEAPTVASMIIVVQMALGRVRTLHARAARRGGVNAEGPVGSGSGSGRVSRSTPDAPNYQGAEPTADAYVAVGGELK